MCALESMKYGVYDFTTIFGQKMVLFSSKHCLIILDISYGAFSSKFFCNILCEYTIHIKA